MPTYVNPATMMGGQLSPQSALHGALAGVQGAYATKMGDQQIRAEDLDFMANMHKYQQSVLDDPVNEIGRTEKIANSGYNIDQITSGRKLDDFDTTLAGKKLGNEKTGLENQDKSIQLKGEFLNEIAQVVDNFNQKDPATTAEWNQYVEKGGALGVKLPSWPDDNTKQLIKARAAAFVNSPKHQNAVDLAQKTAAAQGDQHARPDVTSSVAGFQAAHLPGQQIAVRIATINAVSRERIAEVRAEEAKTFEQLAIVEARKGNIAGAVAAYLKKFGTAFDSLPGEIRNAKIKEATAWAEGVAAGAKANGSAPAAPSPTKSEFTPAQESQIAAAMKANPKATRQQIIDAAKKDGLL